jgi:FlaA1/EpsC-like NDP-sugar epimerase
MSHTFALPARAKATAREPGTVGRGQARSATFWNLTGAVSQVSIVLVDLFAVLLSYWISLKILSAYTDLWLGIARSAVFILLVATTKGFALYHFGVFKGSLRYAGVRELLGLAGAMALSAGILFGASHLVQTESTVPFVVFVLDACVCGITLGAIHFSLRMYESEKARQHLSTRRAVIVGAGDGGASILRQLCMNPDSGIRPVALIDDDPAKRGRSICGIPVAGDLMRLRQVVSTYQASEILICIPSLTRAQMRRILAVCKQCEVPIRTLPTLRELVDGNVSVRDLQRVQIEDVLQRDRITPDPALTRALLGGKVVLVTGAGGSIGSELCLQIAAAGPKRLILLDKSENSLFYSHLAISEKFPSVETHPCLADITDENLMRVIFQRERPQLVFHAAAFKHVGMMQLHPYEAIRNNVLGTRILASLAAETGAERFVNISTDKSVNPRCYMGLSKKFAEMAVKQLGEKHRSRFLNVRFGNVAGSTGSVLRLFNEQIKKGGPIRVTDPQATRYFMSIPEAVYLILCAASRGKQGETYIFDMGEPINIYQLARTLSLFNGYTPEEELPIEFIGLRDGEKVHEELWESWERPHVTENPLLFVLKGTNPSPINIADAVEMFDIFLKTRNHDGLIQYINGLMPSFAQGQIPRVEIQDYSSEAHLVEMPS